jgi:hypothetical protein
MEGNMDGFEEYKKQVDEFSGSSPVNPAKARWWVWAMDKGKWTNIGSEGTEQEAYELGYSRCPGLHFEVKMYETRNVAEAQRRFKRWILDQKHDLGQATSLISRKPAEEKKKKDRLLYELF